MKKLHGYELPFQSYGAAIIDADGNTVDVVTIPHDPRDPDSSVVEALERAGGIAQLFAAAPEMADALKTLVDCFGICKTPAQFVAQIDENGFMKDARAALAKAGVS